MGQERLNSGFITLISVLIVAAIGVTVGIYVILNSLGFARSSLAAIQSAQARALANACANEALQQVHDNLAYAGTGSLVMGEGSCSYTVTVLTGNSRKVIASGTVGTIIRKVQIEITALRPNINVSSWKEVADFN